MKSLEQMRAPWAQRGAQFLNGTAGIDHFGQSPALEAQGLRDGCGLGPDTETAVLRLFGKDHVRFLDGQCTQQIKDRPNGTSGSAFVLEPKGKVVALLSFLVRADDILLLMPKPTAAALQTWLAKFLMLSDAELEDVTADYQLIRIAGPKSASLLEAQDGQPITVAIDTATLPTWLALVPAQGERLTEEFLSALEARAEAAKLGLVLVGDSGFEIARIQQSHPKFAQDLDGSVLPSESGLAEITVSLTKGCYCGQEVVARQHYLGKPRKAVCHLKIECPSADQAVGLVAGLQIMESSAADAKSIGTLTSVVAPPLVEAAEGLAIIKGSELSDGTQVVIASADSGKQWPATLRRIVRAK